MALPHQTIFDERPRGSRGNFRDDIPDAKGIERRALRLSSYVNALAFSTDSQRLAMAHVDGRIIVYDVGAGRVVFDRVIAGMGQGALGIDEHGARILAQARPRGLLELDLPSGRTHIIDLDVDQLHEAGVVNGGWLVLASSGSQSRAIAIRSGVVTADVPTDSFGRPRRSLASGAPRLVSFSLIRLIAGLLGVSFDALWQRERRRRRLRILATTAALAAAVVATLAVVWSAAFYRSHLLVELDLRELRSIARDVRVVASEETPESNRSSVLSNQTPSGDITRLWVPASNVILRVRAAYADRAERGLAFHLLPATGFALSAKRLQLVLPTARDISAHPGMAHIPVTTWIHGQDASRRQNDTAFCDRPSSSHRGGVHAGRRAIDSGRTTGPGELVRGDGTPSGARQSTRSGSVSCGRSARTSAKCSASSRRRTRPGFRRRATS